MRMSKSLSLFLLLALGACDGGADDGDGDPHPDAAAATSDAPTGGADASSERSFAFELDPASITISAGQVPVFQLIDIQPMGFTLTDGYHYHVYLDTTDVPYLIWDDSLPSSRDVEIPSDTAAGTHTIIASIQDGDHVPIGIEASRSLEVLVE